MNESLVKDLIMQFDSSSLTELNWQEETFSLRLSKLENPSNNNTEQIIKPEAVSLPVAKQETFDKKEEVSSKEVAVDENLTDISSPLVGLVYLQENPESKPFKSVGDRVEVGETVCIIEAMKVMNEIQSEVTGVISEICVANEEVVAFNQPLFKVKED